MMITAASWSKGIDGRCQQKESSDERTNGCMVAASASNSAEFNQLTASAAATGVSPAMSRLANDHIVCVQRLVSEGRRLI